MTSETRAEEAAMAQTTTQEADVSGREDQATGEPAAQHSTCTSTGFTSLDLETIRRVQAQFARDRDWEQYHTPRNLLLAFMGEAGELSEIFQWKGEVAAGLPTFSDKEREHVGQELSDCLLYLVRLADVCGVDLGRACMDKIQANAAKYPADKCRGSSAKYTQYT